MLNLVKKPDRDNKRYTNFFFHMVLSSLVVLIGVMIQGKWCQNSVIVDWPSFYFQIWGDMVLVNAWGVTVYCSGSVLVEATKVKLLYILNTDS